MRKFRSEDEVIVIAGKDKGKRGKITKVIDDPKKGMRFVVSGVNMVKKHQKPNPYTGQQGGIVEMEASISASNVAIFNAETGKADRVGFKVLEDGTKVRIFKKTQEQIDG
jgi:large subunit ribosomal protein L24